MRQAPIQKAPGRAGWEQDVPPVLRPMLRAYLLGFASNVTPRLLTLFAQELSSTWKTNGKTSSSHRPRPPLFHSLGRILSGGLDLRNFPTFCAALVGGASLLDAPLSRLLNATLRSTPARTRQRLARFLATFIAAWLSLKLLQSKGTRVAVDEPKDLVEPKSCIGPNGPPARIGEPVRLAGRTLDLTLFAATRAADVVVGELWARRRRRRTAAGKWNPLDELASRAADPAMFAASCALIMWAWFYLPSRLPRGYNKWIGAAAAVDGRLVEALRRCRAGELRYGADNGQAALLQGLCADYKLPPEWGDPSKAVPFPCELVHMGCGPSCEVHALVRFYRSWRWSMATYLPLSLLLVARRPAWKNLQRALVSAARSSAFLGAYISIFYYGVCLARTRLGPRLLGGDVAACQRIDGGICVGTGCFLCGWSILIERAGRRKDMALFVAPRALATLLPRQYDRAKQWRETLVFAASTAVVFTCVLENKARVRGVLGSVLGSVLEA